MNDILGLGKVLPMDKLLDILSKSVGRLSKSYFDKIDANTKAYEIKKLAEARAEEMKIMADAVKQNFSSTGGIEYNKEGIAISSPKELALLSEESSISNPELSIRTQERLDFQEQKRQLNIESITAYAAEQLKDEDAVTDEPVDVDWISRFFKIIEDVSNENMQALWGKILAGEVKQPKSYSLRTLELLRNLSQKEAEVFNKVARFAIRKGSNNFLFTGSDDKILSEEHNISYADRALLTEIGLIQPGTFVNYQIHTRSQDADIVFIAGPKVLVVKVKANTPLVTLPIDVFSTAGNELLTLVEPAPPMDFIRSIFKPIKNDNINVVYADILKVNADSVTHTTPLLEL
ncbi:DUF2806 domain-containing protein [Sphingobacterium sp. DN00404]|uniref:DUF2806 domain-containing protein n=1 Tax=Sphingobacterium micropteri TaxID=2763501 RepID=A0ABR7YM49_9SPHI|nr:DUF2806 domain-containing protein [Sphingobacterium micropteri]MBD1432393.1 DUF2806 domain-containing protein [Sphingobacterium micropteri]